MALARYHYSPSTGEPGYCRAKPGNCPFIAQGSTHSDSKDGARRAYEEFQESGFQSLTAQLMVNRARVQREIIRIFTDPVLHAMDDDENGLNELVGERGAIDRAITLGSLEPSSAFDMVSRKQPQARTPLGTSSWRGPLCE